MSSRQKGDRVAVVCVATVGDEGLEGTIGEVWTQCRKKGSRLSWDTLSFRCLWNIVMSNRQDGWVPLSTECYLRLSGCLHLATP